MQVQGIKTAIWVTKKDVRRSNRLFEVSGDARDQSETFLAMKESAKVEILSLAQSQDDYWSAEQTAKRILDTAKRLAGDDPSKIELLRNAVMTGFREAERILGGLPSVCHDTYNLVMEGFDQWERESGLDAVV
ncbi:MAG: hypothetical protein ACM3X4_03110 [Ignavibacteriales bacterium]